MYEWRCDYFLLAALRTRIDETLAQIHPEQVAVSRKLGMELDKKLKIEKNQLHGYFFRLSRADAVVLRNQSGIIELGTQKSGVSFTTPTLRALSEQFVELTSDYDKKQAVLVKEIMQIVVTYCPIMELLNDLIAQLDVLVACVHRWIVVLLID
jgi:DNA mismatch repair protein MSH2